MLGKRVAGALVCVKQTADKQKLRGYIGRVVATEGHNIIVMFNVKIDNQTDTATLPIGDVELCPS